MISLDFSFDEILQRCEFCNIVDDCYPYGLHHEEICTECAMKDPGLTEIRMKEFYIGEEDVRF